MKNAISILFLFSGAFLTFTGCSTDSHLEAMEKSSASMSENSKHLADSTQELAEIAKKLTMSVERLEKRLGFTLDQFDHFMNQVRIKEEPGQVDDIQAFIDKIRPEGSEGKTP